MMPIFIRIWLTKTTMVFDLLIVAVNFLRPETSALPEGPYGHPPSPPRFSALGTRAATEFDDDHIHRATANQNLCNLQSLFSCIGLGDEEVIDFYTQFLGVLSHLTHVRHR